MRSIRKTITYSTILWVALILTVGQIVVDSVVSNWLIKQFDTALESKARALVILTKYDGIEVEMDFADEFMPEFESPDKPEYFVLFLANANLLEKSHSFDGHAEPEFKNQDNEVRIADLTLPDGRRGRQISIKFVPQIEDKALRKKIPEEQRPRAILSISLERESLDTIIRNVHLLIIGISLVVLVAVMMSTTRAINAGLKPLIQIKDDISRISPHSIDRRIDNQGQPDELKPIATQFNLVLSEIEKAFTRERQFSSDVAHELRTPVSELRSLAEVGLRWPDERDIDSYFSDIHESSRNLDLLIENLLHLCRSEEGHIELEISQVKLGELLAKICRSLNHEITEKNLTIDLPVVNLTVVLVDAQWIELILQNLIFNAISHSPDDATISMQVKSDLEYSRLEICNPMLDPLSREDLEMIFDRFWRKDVARESGSHAGIGLSLVKSYAGLMNLDVSTTITDKGEFCISLSKIKNT